VSWRCMLALVLLGAHWCSDNSWMGVKWERGLLLVRCKEEQGERNRILGDILPAYAENWSNSNRL